MQDYKFGPSWEPQNSSRVGVVMLTSLEGAHIVHAT